MALVKKAALGARGARKKVEDQQHAKVPAPRSASRPAAKRPVNAIERMDQATQELAGGLAEAAAAASELQRAVDQISSGAEEAAGAAQESLGLIGNLRAGFRQASDQAAAALRQSEMLRVSFGEVAAQIDASVAAITLNAERQLGSVTIVERLEQAASAISAVGATVGDLSEQTSMLALNASIEAVRAGDVGKGFAIVADEVRELADTAEKSAGDIQTLAGAIVEEIRVIGQSVAAAASIATTEASSGSAIAAELQRSRVALAELIAGAEEVSSAALEADEAATEAEKGAEQVASAAEEQSAAAAEAQQAIQQQAVSLDQSQQAAESLGELTTQLEETSTSTAAIEEIAAAAEELSATVQELSGASGQILVAIEQIARGAQVQSAATIQAGAAMTQIEKSAQIAEKRARTANEWIGSIVDTVANGRTAVAKLVDGVGSSVVETRAVLDRLAAVGETARRIEKISDSLALVALQTNLLAVSGTVEATRAGDAGSGFAIVTADIRKLAREAATNAEDAKDVVRAIQDHLAVMRRDLDQIAGAGDAEAGRNAAMIERFETMSTTLGETQSANGVILQSAEIVLRSAREVKSGCDQIAIAADLAAGSAREAGAAARQQAQGAEDLAAAIEDIAALAASLASRQA